MGMILFSAMPCLFEDIFPTDDHEWQVYMIVSSVLSISNYVPSVRKELQKCFTAFTFLARLYYYPDAVLDEVEGLVDLETLHQTFYRCYQEQFCLSRNKVRRRKARKCLCNLM